MRRATKLMLDAHDVAELETFRRYLEDRQTMPPRQFYCKYQKYMGLSDQELTDILAAYPGSPAPAKEKDA